MCVQKNLESLALRSDVGTRNLILFRDEFLPQSSIAISTTRVMNPIATSFSPRVSTWLFSFSR